MTLLELQKLPWMEVPLKVSASMTVGELAAFSETANALDWYLNFAEMELWPEGASLDICGDKDDWDELEAMIDGTEGVEIDWDAVAELVGEAEE